MRGRGQGRGCLGNVLEAAVGVRADCAVALLLLYTDYVEPTVLLGCVTSAPGSRVPIDGSAHGARPDSLVEYLYRYTLFDAVI